MSDLIRRSDAVKVIDRMKHRLVGNGLTYEIIRQMILEIPSIEPKRGEWKNYKDEHYCSNCGEVVIDDWYDTDDWYNFCPNCGAEMEEREGE